VYTTQYAKYWKPVETITTLGPKPVSMQYYCYKMVFFC